MESMIKSMLMPMIGSMLMPVMKLVFVSIIVCQPVVLFSLITGSVLGLEKRWES